MSHSNEPNPGESSRREDDARPGDIRVPRCATVGHEQLPAAALGVFDDGDQATPEVPYCADCAQLLAAAAEYTITEALDPDALGSTVCPQCHGAGRLPRPHAGVVDAAGPAAQASPAGHDQSYRR